MGVIRGGRVSRLRLNGLLWVCLWPGRLVGRWRLARWLDVHPIRTR